MRWCSFNVVLLLSREVTAEKTRPLTQADKKPKERVKTEHEDGINLDAAGSVIQFKVTRHFYTAWWKPVGNTRFYQGDTPDSDLMSSQ